MAFSWSRPLFPAESAIGRDAVIAVANLANRAKRYDDMAAAVNQAVQMNPKLTIQERTLLASAYTNAVGVRRRSLQCVRPSEPNKNQTSFRVQRRTIKRFRFRIEKEVTVICEDFIDLINISLLTNAQEISEKVFYLKTRGDFFRYLVEITNTAEEDEVMEKTQQSYEEAMELAMNLRPTDPLRLGCALNFSAFLVDVALEHGKGCDLVKLTFDEAIAELRRQKEQTESQDNLRKAQGEPQKTEANSHTEEDEALMQETILLMCLLRDCLTLWTTDTGDDEENGLDSRF